MKTKILKSVGVGLFTLALIASAQAQQGQNILGSATIYYDSQTNTMSASCVMDPSYGVETYYEPNTECSIYDANNNQIEFGDAITTEIDLPEFTPKYDMTYNCYADFFVEMVNYDYQNFGSYYWDWYDPYFFYYYYFNPVESGGDSYDWYGYPFYGENETNRLVRLGEVTAEPKSVIPTSLSGTLGSQATYTGQALADCSNNAVFSAFWGYRRCVSYNLLDQNGDWIKQAGITINENLTIVATTVGNTSHTASATTGSNGDFNDTLSFGLTPPNAPPGPQPGEYTVYKQTITTTNNGHTRTLRVGCINYQYNDLTWTNITSGGTCP
jgi:hypothetical protein